MCSSWKGEWTIRSWELKGQETYPFFLICLLHVGSEKDDDGFYFKGNTSVPSYHRTEELQPSTENWDDQGN